MSTAAIRKDAGYEAASAFLRLRTQIAELQATIVNAVKNGKIVVGHDELGNLDFASSAHTGFASTTQLNAVIADLADWGLPEVLGADNISTLTGEVSGWTINHGSAPTLTLEVSGNARGNIQAANTGVVSIQAGTTPATVAALVASGNHRIMVVGAAGGVGTFHVKNGASSDVVTVTVDQQTSQTADLIQVRDSSDAVRMSVDITGKATFEDGLTHAFVTLDKNGLQGLNVAGLQQPLQLIGNTAGSGASVRVIAAVSPGWLCDFATGAPGSETIRAQMDLTGQLFLGTIAGGNEYLTETGTQTITNKQIQQSVEIIDDTDSPYTASTNHVVLCNAGSGAITVTLPTASGITGLTYWVKKTDSSANAITVEGDGSETIDGALNQTLASQYDSLTLMSDGTNWMII